MPRITYLLKTIGLVILFAIASTKLFAQTPIITSFSPDSGSVGTLVTITGTNLNNIDTIRIGGIPAIKISATNTNLVAMVMPGAITGNIYIANNIGNVTSGTNFTKIDNIPPAVQQGNKLVGTGNIGVAYQGASVSISADGNTAIVGGSGDNSNQGAAWIYVRSGGVWTQQGSKLVGTGNIGAATQGGAVSISADGNTAIVGGNNDSNSRGAVWIYTRSGGVWSQQGNKLVGMSSVGVAYQGVSVSLSADGNTAIVGGYGDNSNQGAAWVYTRSGGIWSQQGNKLVGLGNIGIAYQGMSVSISADGTTAIVGGYGDNSNQGAAWVYTRSGGIWSQQGNKLVGTGSGSGLYVFQGYSVSLSADGNTAMVGGYGDNNFQGAAWIYTRSAGVWSQQGSKLLGLGRIGAAYQGRSVSLSADGNTAIFGGNRDSSSQGATWIFKRTGLVWSQQGSKLVGTGRIGAGNQGWSVSLSANGNTAMVGGALDNSSQGAVWIYNGALPSVNANLSAIALSAGNLNPVFATAITNYTVSLSNSITSLTITPTKADTNATIQLRVNGGAYVTISSGIPSSPLLLNIGSNTVDVKVTAQDGVTIKIYTITIINVSPPTITSFSPISGSIGTLVTITGTNLNNLDTIKIGGVPAIKVSSTSTSLVAMVMQGAATGTIYIANIVGNFTSSTNFTLINSIIPSVQQGGKLVGGGFVGVDGFQGYSVSVSATGNTAIVGAPHDNNGEGAARVYQLIGGVWTQQGAKLVGSGSVYRAMQGTSVSISADGNTAILGGAADNSNRGAAWIFTRNGNVWSQQGGKLVGTGNINGAQQGSSVSISADGNTTIIGGTNDSNGRGAAWIFTRYEGVWSQQGGKLVGTGNMGLSQQGCSVNINADGNTAIIGGWYDSSGLGAAWVFTRNGGVWSQQGSKLVGLGYVGNANQGKSVSLSADGNTAIVGGYGDNNQGAAWVFTRSGNIWSQQGSKLVGLGAVGAAGQGSSVSLSANGNTAIVGGSYDSSGRGAVWVFTRSGGVWAQEGSKLIGANSIGKGVYQGNSVSLSADANTFIVGGYNDNNAQGAAWVFNHYRSVNANLNIMSFNSGILVPTFVSTTTSYTLATAASNITVVSSIADSNAIIQLRINGGSYTILKSGSISSVLPLNVGNNTIEVKVTAQDGVTIKTYTTTVTSTPLQPSITSFSPSSGSIGTLVTITGVNLKYLTALTIGSKGAIEVSNTGTSLVAMVMPGTPNGVISVSNNKYSTATGSSFIVTSSISPVVQQGNKLAGNDYALGPVRHGISVSVSADGNTAIVGGYADSSNLGAAWIYTRSGNVWSQEGRKLIGTGSIGIDVYQGYSVAISADGNTAIVGGYYDNEGRGAAWIYTRSGGIWSQQGNKLTGSGNGGKSNFATSVSLSADGNTAIIGGLYDETGMGAAWIYTRSGGVWSQDGDKLVGTGYTRAACQGSSVSISADGNTAVIGGDNDDNFNGAAWVFVKNGGVWSQQGNKLVGTLSSPNVGAYQGTSVGISADGNTIIVGGYGDDVNMGAAWIFVRNNGVWSEQSKLTMTGSCCGFLGSSVSISADGNKAIVGAMYDSSSNGAALLYYRSGSVWRQLGNKLVGTGGIGKPHQGMSVSISADGRTALVGGESDSNSRGAVWIYNAVMSSTINVTGTLSPFFSCSGNTSSQQTFTVSGTGLSTDSILISAPAGFEVSKTLDNGYGSSLKLAPNMGNVSNTTIYVRMTLSASGALSGNIVCASPNAFPQSVTASRVTLPKPNVGFTINSASQCLVGNNFLFTDTSNIVSGTITRKWDFGSGNNDTSVLINPSKSYSNANSYSVKLISISSNNCTDSITKTVTVNAQPTIGTITGNMTPSSITSPFTYSILNQANTTYNWSVINGTIQSGQGTNTIDVIWPIIGTGSLKAKITNSNVCSDSVSLAVNITSVGVNEVVFNSFSNISFKPNPFTEELELQFTSLTKKEARLTIIDALGKVAYVNKLDNLIVGEITIALNDVSNLKGGIYFAYIENEEGKSKPIKIIKN
ncbi:MAG: cadherin-like beta sandwich domain-containing protein [Bacteroidota bacterium]